MTGGGGGGREDHGEVLVGNGCLLCDEAVPESGLLAHLAARHPDRIDVFEGWPEGVVVVVDTEAA